MRNTLQSVLNSYRKYRESRAKSRTYRTVRYLVFALAGAYIVLLSYPQILFAHETSYKNFEVYSREPLDNEVYAVLDKVETRLAVSPINDQKLKPRIFLINSYGLYATLSLYFGSSSFGKGFVVLPSNNIFINKSGAGLGFDRRNGKSSFRQRCNRSPSFAGSCSRGGKTCAFYSDDARCTPGKGNGHPRLQLCC